jgi:hypothetical protein
MPYVLKLALPGWNPEQASLPEKDIAYVDNIVSAKAKHSTWACLTTRILSGFLSFSANCTPWKRFNQRSRA